MRCADFSHARIRSQLQVGKFERVACQPAGMLAIHAAIPWCDFWQQGGEDYAALC